MGKSPLSVQSFCFRDFKDNHETAGLVKEIGLSAIEICGIHCDFGDQSGHQSCIDTYSRAGVRIASIGVNGLSSREANKPFFEFAKKAGLKVMSVNFSLDDRIEDSLKTADAMAEEYGIDLGIHNHGGHHWLGNNDSLAWVFSKTSRRVGLCLDTAWALDARMDPIKTIRTFGDRLHVVHLKDFVFNRDRTQEDVIVGTGNIDLGETRQALKEVGFEGEAIIEYEGDRANPVPSLRECVIKIRSELSEILTEA
jgi:inosose dehydratase